MQHVRQQRNLQKSDRLSASVQKKEMTTKEDLDAYLRYSQVK